MNRHGGLALAVLLALLPLQPGWCEAASRIGGELGYGYDGNANSARNGGDERSSRQLRGRLALDSTWQLSPQAAVQLQTGIEGQHDFKFDGLSNARLSGLARVLFRPCGGFYAPTFTLSGGAAHWDFNSRQRDSAEYRGSAHLTEQITTRISARLGFSAVWREARGEVFDLDARSGLLDLDWNVHPRLALYFGYQYREGDLVSTAAVAPAAALASAPDDAFNRPGDIVFRLAADAQTGTLGFNYALTPQLALDVQTQFIDAEADLGTRYQRWLSTAGLLFRF